MAPHSDGKSLKQLSVSGSLSPKGYPIMLMLQKDVSRCDGKNSGMGLRTTSPPPPAKPGYLLLLVSMPRVPLYRINSSDSDEASGLVKLGQSMTF